MFRLELLPAAHGDCLWIEYGSGAEVRRILIDGGPGHTYPALYQRVLHLPEEQRKFELFIITHIDADHIEGAIRLLNDAKDLKLRFERIWFNGRAQLAKVPNAPGTLGATQGEMLSVLIGDYERDVKAGVWNAGLPNGLAAYDDQAALPTVTLAGDCKLTLLSPDHQQLRQLRIHWDAELKKENITSGDDTKLRALLLKSKTLKGKGVLGGADQGFGAQVFELPQADGSDKPPTGHLGGGKGEPGEDAAFGSDGSLANGSSIAVLLEYPAADPEVRLILSGDAWAPVLEKAVDKLLPELDARLPLTAFKIPHHGSVGNVTESLLAKLRCREYLISTSGAKFRHPHGRTVRLLLDKHGGQGRPTLNFNYQTLTTAAWTDPAKQKADGYLAEYPSGLSRSWPE